MSVGANQVAGWPHSGVGRPNFGRTKGSSSASDFCGGINPYTLTARLGLEDLSHYEMSSRLDPTVRSFAQGNKTWRSSRILVG